MSSQKRLFLLDAFALLYRAHFAFIKNPRRTKTGLNTSALYGFTNYLIDIVTKENPTHLGVAFDTSAPTFRHIAYEPYKAQRDETPEDLIIAVPYVLRMLQALNIPALKLDGFEADDIIGTIATQVSEDIDVFMVTPDKDYAQLVKPNVFLYRPPGPFDSTYQIYDHQRCIEKFGVPPEQMVDYLGLVGDASDNIPGVPKIGEKTAISLLTEYKSLEDILDNIENISKKALKETLTQFGEQGRFSKFLATIKTDVPFEWNIQDLAIGGTDMEALTSILTEVEFRTTAQRLMNSRFNPIGPATQTDLFGNPVGGYVPQTPASSSVSPATTQTPTVAEMTGMKTIKDIEHTYHLLRTPAEINALLKKIQLAKFCSVDTETTSLDERSAELVGICFAIQPKDAYFIYFEDEKQAREILSQTQIKQVLEDATILKIGQNLKYDIQIFKNYDIHLQGKMFDTMLAHYVWKPEGKHGMDDMARELLGYSPISYKEMTNNGKILLRDVNIQTLTEYAAEDADITLQLYDILKEKVAGNKIFEEIEMPLMEVLTEMEYAGVKIDKQALALYSKDLDEKLQKLKLEILALSGQDFNIDSPAQLGVILFEKLKLGKGKKTKTGQYSTDEDVLTELAVTHELPGIVLTYRGLKKLKSTYVDALPKLINPITGRVHTTFSQSIAVTGRLSSVHPNLQNIPIRSEDGKEVRRGFITEGEEFVLLSADYSQVELRLMAAFSKDPNMIQAFQEGADIHRQSAAKVFGVSEADVTPDMRSKAKTVNFGIIYGISAHGLSQRMRIGRSEAKEIIDAYFTQYPNVKQFMDGTIVSAREKGYVETLLGRKRYLPDIQSQNHTIRSVAERNAINSPIQGSAADIIKLAMIHIAAAMKEQNMRSRMILQVHDELVFEAHLSEIDVLKALIKDKMMHAVDLVVPLEVEMGTGKNWLEAH